MTKRIFSFFLLLSFTNLLALEYDLKLSQNELQTIIEKKFPYEKKRFMSYVKVFNPVILLKENSKKIFIASDVKINLLEQFDFDTSSLLSGILKFDAKTNDFYLDDFKVEELDLKDLPQELKELSIQNIEKLANYQFKQEPIYHLDKNVLGSIASQFDIQDVEVKDKNMVIKLKVF